MMLIVILIVVKILVMVFVLKVQFVVMSWMGLV